MFISANEIAIIFGLIIFMFLIIYLFSLYQCVFNRTRNLNKFEDFEEAKKFYRNTKVGLFFPCLTPLSYSLSTYYENGLTFAFFISLFLCLIFLIMISNLLANKEKI